MSVTPRRLDLKSLIWALSDSAWAVVDRMKVPPLESTGNVYEDALSCVLDMRIHCTPTASTASWNAGNPTPPSRRATCTGFGIR